MSIHRGTFSPFTKAAIPLSFFAAAISIAPLAKGAFVGPGIAVGALACIVNMWIWNRLIRRAFRAESGSPSSIYFTKLIALKFSVILLLVTGLRHLGGEASTAVFAMSLVGGYVSTLFIGSIYSLSATGPKILSGPKILNDGK